MRVSGAGALVFLAAVTAAAGPPASEPSFVAWPLPYTAFNLFDAGVADVNDDGNLDVYTSDHSATQLMLAGDGRGGFEDRLSAWRLDENPDFPGFEVPKSKPDLRQPGLYIYRDVSQFVLEARATDRVPPIRGSVRLSPGATVVDARQFRHRQETVPGRLPETILWFEAVSEGFLIFRPELLEVPLSFEIAGELPLGAIHVGARGVTPVSKRFTLMLRDRHGMAWADVDRDGGLDVFINRGGLSGHLAELPGLVRDELLVQTRNGFEDRIGGLGFDKGDCRGRQAAWVDFDGDGTLELHSGCFQGPERFYRRAGEARFQDVGPQIWKDGGPTGTFEWLDADGDGDMDLLAQRRKKLVLYRNQRGILTQQPLAGIRDLEKLAVCDHDSDGDPDVYAASAKADGMFFVNHRGRLLPVPPGLLGLPPRALAANWVDFDNDGLPDLHFIPGGLYRQTPDHRFQAVRLLDQLPFLTALEARCNWFDMDNDGRPDLLMAVRYRVPWLLRLFPLSLLAWDERAWHLSLARNTGGQNHWLELVLAGTPGNRQAIGARVTLRAAGRTSSSQVGWAEGSHFSQGHYRLYFGLGAAAAPVSLSIRWPEGGLQELDGVRPDQVLRIPAPTAAEKPLEAR